MIKRRSILVPTASGVVGIGLTGRAISRLSLPEEDHVNVAEQLYRWSGVTPVTDTVSPLARKIVAYYDGKRVDFTSPPLDLSWASPFARSVYEAARTIPWGTTATYGEVAKMIGRPTVARGVGAALGANRIPLVIPCHRVVAADGRLTGFSAPGGVETKRRMLALEGAI